MPRHHGTNRTRIRLRSISFTFNQRPPPLTSFRSRDGGSFMFMIKMSTSPSLSKSPNATPRLQCASEIAGPPHPAALRNARFPGYETELGAIVWKLRMLLSTSGNVLPVTQNRSGNPSLSKSAIRRPSSRTAFPLPVLIAASLLQMQVPEILVERCRIFRKVVFRRRADRPGRNHRSRFHAGLFIAVRAHRQTDPGRALQKFRRRGCETSGSESNRSDINLLQPSLSRSAATASSPNRGVARPIPDCSVTSVKCRSRCCGRDCRSGAQSARPQFTGTPLKSSSACVPAAGTFSSQYQIVGTSRSRCPSRFNPPRCIRFPALARMH